MNGYHNSTPRSNWSSRCNRSPGSCWPGWTKRPRLGTGAEHHHRQGRVNPDGILENSDDVTVAHTLVGTYELTVDVTGDTLPAGTTEDDFEVFVTVKEDSPQLLYVPYYVPISLVGTTLRINVIITTNMTTPTDRGFSVQVLLPAG